MLSKHCSSTFLPNIKLKLERTSLSPLATKGKHTNTQMEDLGVFSCEPGISCLCVPIYSHLHGHKMNSCVTTLFHHNNKQRLNGRAVRQPRTATHNGTEQHERGGNLQRWVLSPHCSGFIEFTLLHLSAHTHWLTTATTEEHRSHRRRLTLITDETSHWGCTLEASPVRSDCRLRAWAIIQSLGYVVWQIPLLFRWIIIILVWHVCSLQWLTPKVVQKQGSYFLQATIDLARWNVNCC